MRRNYQDAMAIVRKFGKPDLFITMTANPGWPEITEQLLPEQSYLDRPDICVRVYEQKAEAFLDDILKNQIFGKVPAFFWTKEFQKRGLPHIHSLIMLNDEDKITSVERLDKLIWAEIPDKDVYPELYKIVTKTMMHGPCLPSSACMQKDGVKCSKHFPKDWSNVTILNDNGYPTYRRRNDGRKVMVNGYELDNRHVVPYNPYLLMKYNCHINVECCATVQSVKYLYKYICKGHDCAIVQINGQDNVTHDETINYLSKIFFKAVFSEH